MGTFFLGLCKMTFNYGNNNIITVQRMDEEHIWHTKQLAKHCRVCGQRLQRAKTKTKTSSIFSCMERKEELQVTFGITVNDDDNMIHPTRFCSSCYLKTKRRSLAIEKSQPYDPVISVYVWIPHVTVTCKVR